MLVSHFTLRFKELKIEMVYLLVQTNKIIYVLLIVYLYNFYTNKKTKKNRVNGQIYHIFSCLLLPQKHLRCPSSFKSYNENKFMDVVSLKIKTAI